MKYQDLRSATSEELVDHHDAKDRHTVYGTAYYLDELRHREKMAVLHKIASSLAVVEDYIVWKSCQEAVSLDVEPKDRLKHIEELKAKSLKGLVAAAMEES
ncbi:MAG: hypothetical protein OXN97_25245 [Bryobacterales bacterium]|nr:hypothetical protein [Bryobacterales bacterium]